MALVGVATGRTKRRLLLGVGTTGLLLLAVGGLVIWITIWTLHNTVVIPFLESFEIVNNSGEDIHVTPIGMVEGSGRYAPLPRYGDEFPPAVRMEPSYNIFLKAGSVLRITYDMDDINFRHILVRTGENRVLIVDTDRRGTLMTSYGPKNKHYQVPTLEQLQTAPEEVIPCTRGQYVQFSGMKEYPEYVTK